MKELSFPADFVFGAATSAYQIEGAAREDGRGESIWDRFSATPGKTIGGATGEVACDHYHRYREDIALLGAIGARSYRFSIAWPRVLPLGKGQVEERGLAFYDRLVDALLEAGISPLPTLYHWDLPQALQDAGGWPSRDTAHAFVDYAAIVARRLGDRIPTFLTHNEPWCASILSHQLGLHAPGLQSWPLALSAAHHLLLSHGLAARAIRAERPGARVGIALNLVPADAASPSHHDRQACAEFDGYFNRWFLDPIFGRGYPADMIAAYQRDGKLPEGGLPVREGDLAAIAAPLDLLGINYYMRAVVRSGLVPEEENAPRTVELAPMEEWTEMGWEVHPDGLRQLLLRVQADYSPKELLITENGCSYGDEPGEGGRVRDERRVRFLRDHLAACRQAIDAGVPLRGYYAWSLLDNFEWDRGYGQRFGLVHVDYATQKRTIKDSGHWYRALALP